MFEGRDIRCYDGYVGNYLATGNPEELSGGAPKQLKTVDDFIDALRELRPFIGDAEKPRVGFFMSLLSRTPKELQNEILTQLQPNGAWVGMIQTSAGASVNVGFGNNGIGEIASFAAGYGLFAGAIDRTQHHFDPKQVTDIGDVGRAMQTSAHKYRSTQRQIGPWANLLKMGKKKKIAGEIRTPADLEALPKNEKLRAMFLVDPNSGEKVIRWAIDARMAEVFSYQSHDSLGRGDEHNDSDARKGYLTIMSNGNIEVQ